MKTVNRLRRMAGAAVLLTALSALFVITACGGPERAPRQPITGVDQPADTRAPNPHDEPEEVPDEPDNGSGAPRPMSMAAPDRSPRTTGAAQRKPA